MAAVAFEHAFLPEEWAWGDALPAPQQWQPVTAMQQDRILRGANFIWLNVHGHRQFLLTVHDVQAELRIYMNFHARHGARCMVRPVGPQMNVMVHADYLPDQGIVRFLSR